MQIALKTLMTFISMDKSDLFFSGSCMGSAFVTCWTAVQLLGCQQQMQLCVLQGASVVLQYHME